MVWELFLRCRNIRVTGFAMDADGRQRGAYPRLPPLGNYGVGIVVALQKENLDAVTV